MSKPSRLRSRPVVFTVAAVFWLAAGSLFWSLRPTSEAPSVELVDNREALIGLLDERHREGADGSAEASVDEEGEDEKDDADAGATSTPSVASEPAALVREPLDEEDAATFYPNLGRKGWVYHPLVYFHNAVDRDTWYDFEEHPAGGFTFRTNSLGLRQDGEIREAKPDLRILITGDSHTAGLCENSESYPSLLEGLLAERFPGASIEVINAGNGSYNMYNYLGVLERFEHLEPDLFLVTVYGGNDFHATAQLHRYFHRAPAPKAGRVRQGRVSQGALAQELSQVAYMVDNPKDERRAGRAAEAITREIRRRCDEAGIELLCAYLPPASHVQPQHFSRSVSKVMRLEGIPPEAAEVSERISRRWLAFLEAESIPALDLGPFLQGDEPSYWLTDLHLNLRGHALVADALLGPVSKRLENHPSVTGQ